MDYQAFVLVGNGKHLEPFSKNKGDSEKRLVKALLPIANRPMIEYMLDWCEQAAFSEINIVVDEKDAVELTEGLQPYLKRRAQAHETLLKNLKDNNESVNSSFFKTPNDIHIIPTKGKNSGEILYKELVPKITRDFVLLPCDFITDIPPQILKYQFLNSPDNQICMSVHYKNVFETVDKNHLGTTYTLYHKNKLLDSYSKESVVKARYLKVRNQLLWRYPSISFSQKLMNSSIYFCKLSILDIFDQLVQHKSDFFHNRPLDKIFRDLARRSWKHADGKETVGMFIIPKEGTMIRANNLSSYLEINRYMLKLNFESGITSSNRTLFTNVNGQNSNGATVGADSLVGTGCSLGEKSSIKKSVVGNNCKVGKKCKIIGSILFDDVELEDECHIENCIVGKGVRVEKKSKLTNCNVQSKYLVHEEAVYKGETLKSIFVNEEKTGFDSAAGYEDDDDLGFSDNDNDDDDESVDYNEQPLESDDAFSGDDFFDRG